MLKFHLTSYNHQNSRIKDVLHKLGPVPNIKMNCTTVFFSNENSGGILDSQPAPRWSHEKCEPSRPIFLAPIHENHTFDIGNHTVWFQRSSWNDHRSSKPWWIYPKKDPLCWPDGFSAQISCSKKRCQVIQHEVLWGKLRLRGYTKVRIESFNITKFFLSGTIVPSTYIGSVSRCARV